MERNNRYTVADYIRSFQQGEEKGFGYFFREYYASLCYFSFQISKDKGVAEEIAGDALMKLWERHIHFDNIPSVKSFLYTTTRNASVDWLRRQKRSKARTKEIIYLAEETEGSVVQKMIETETYNEIFAVLNTLPPKCRQIFNMLYVQGKNYQQIAEELGLSINTIRNQKARGLSIIKQRIALFLFATLLLFQII